MIDCADKNRVATMISFNPANNTMETIREALRLCETGNEQPARDIFNQLIREPTLKPEIAALFGKLCLQLGEYDFALQQFDIARASNPVDHHILWLAGTCHYKLHHYPEALMLLQQAVNLDPENATYLNDLAAVTIMQRRYAAALPLLERAFALDADDPNILANLANCLSELGQYEKALAAAGHYLQYITDNPFIFYVVARCHDDLGHRDEAIRNYQKCIELEPTFGMAYQGIAGAKKFTPEDMSFSVQAESALKHTMSVSDRALIHFALGKMYDDTKNWDRAFFNYQRGNILKKSLINTTPRPPYELFEAIQKAFTAQLFSAPPVGSPSTVPIFIIGMPRSGSTLLEQIISSHTGVAGAGELEAIDHAFASLCPDGKLDNLGAELQKLIDNHGIQSLANTYLESLPARTASVVRVIDKQLFNYVHLGLIALMFPNAKIFHCVRDPVDTCLSCYFQNFKYINWACDPVWIARQYHFYRDVMAYWSKTLPPGRIIDVHYEQLVADPELQIRQLIAYCDLDWDPACLDFHKSAKSINTASLWQARRPIYKSSTQRWKHYAPHIQDLVRLLEPAVTGAKQTAAQPPKTQGLWQKLKSRLIT